MFVENTEELAQNKLLLLYIIIEKLRGIVKWKTTTS